MSEHFEVMPDYLAALELELRGRAVSVTDERSRSVASHRLPFGWRPPVLASALAALGLVLLLLMTGTTGKETRAYGMPAILAARPVPIPAFVHRGLLLQLRAGRGVELRRARPFPTPDGTAYLLDGDGVWCLSVPDPTADDPRVERGSGCTRSQEFLRLGIQVVSSRRFVAVIPQGVRDPSVIHANGSTESLHPSARGIVTYASVSRGDTFVLYGTDGHRRTIYAR